MSSIISLSDHSVLLLLLFLLDWASLLSILRAFIVVRVGRDARFSVLTRRILYSLHHFRSVQFSSVQFPARLLALFTAWTVPLVTNDVSKLRSILPDRPTCNNYYRIRRLVSLFIRRRKRRSKGSHKLLLFILQMARLFHGLSPTSIHIRQSTTPSPNKLF